MIGLLCSIRLLLHSCFVVCNNHQDTTHTSCVGLVLYDVSSTLTCFSRIYLLFMEVLLGIEIYKACKAWDLQGCLRTYLAVLAQEGSIYQ